MSWRFWPLYSMGAIVGLLVLSWLPSLWLAIVWTVANAAGVWIHLVLLREARRDHTAILHLRSNGRRLLLIGINIRTELCLLGLQTAFMVVGLIALLEPYLPKLVTTGLTRSLVVLPIPLMAVVGWLNHRDRKRVDAITDTLNGTG